MKQIKNYIINDCGCTKSHFRDILVYTIYDFKGYILVYISYTLLKQIIKNFNLEEIIFLEDELK
jgi:hypothetical protein